MAEIKARAGGGELRTSLTVSPHNIYIAVVSIIHEKKKKNAEVGCARQHTRYYAQWVRWNSLQRRDALVHQADCAVHLLQTTFEV